MIPYRSLTALAACLMAGAAVAADHAYLFDALQDRVYRAAWDKLMKDVQPTPDWLVQFNRNFDGDSGDMAQVKIGDRSYWLSFVCKPTDCAARKFVVMFDGTGAHAVGAFGGKDSAPEYFGAPSKDEQDALAKGFGGSPALK